MSERYEALSDLIYADIPKNIRQLGHLVFDHLDREYVVSFLPYSGSEIGTYKPANQEQIKKQELEYWTLIYENKGHSEGVAKIKAKLLLKSRGFKLTNLEKLNHVISS